MPVPIRFNPFYQDGDYATPQRISRSPREYPFRALGDTTSYAYRSTYVVLLSRFTPTACGTADPEDASAVLLEESVPQPVGPGGRGVLATFVRRYGTVPLDQTSYGNMSISLPHPSGVGTAVNVQRVTGSGTSANLGSNYEFAGGVFVVNALASAYSGYYNAIFGPKAAVTSATSGSDERVTWTGHGLAGTEKIAVYCAHGGGSLTGWLLFGPGEYTVVDVDTVDLLGWGASITGATFAAEYLHGYTPGTRILRTKLTQEFYADGSTIPVPASLLSDADLLTAAVAHASGYVGYSTSSPALWSNSHLYATTLTEILIDDM